MKKLPALFAVVLFECVALGQTLTPKTTYILAGRLFDATSEKVRENAVITIAGDRIAAVSDADSAKPRCYTCRKMRCGQQLGGSRPVG